MKITFDDVLISPRFSDIESRKDVDISTKFGDYTLQIPVFSANMDSITETKMANSMYKNGGFGVLHRFCSIKENCDMYTDIAHHNGKNCAVSVGLGKNGLERAEALAEMGAEMFFLDVAHGAQMQVVRQYDALKNIVNHVTVGNFATSASIREFIGHLGYVPDAIKVGIGPGGVCETRVKTGVGIPQLSAILDCNKEYNGKAPFIIADGGLKTSGDIAKALAAGANAVMVGGMLASTIETPGEGSVRIYKGSASQEAYEHQNKISEWRTAEGTSKAVNITSTVKEVLQDINGGLRSSFTYVGARNLKEFHEKSSFNIISTNSTKENGAHGKF